MVPALIWPWASTIGYVLVAPLGCASFSMSRITDGIQSTVRGATRCDAVFFTYAGDASYDPPIWPAVLAGITLATGVSLLARRWIVHRTTRTRASQRVS
jgi:hypothetical protein